jgi:hypothetical protein
MSSFEASYVSVDSSGFTCVPAPALASQGETSSASFSERSESVAKGGVAVREAVAVFHSANDLQNAIDALLRSGFHRAALSLLANEAEVVSKLGHVYHKTGDLVADPAVARAAYVSPEAVGDGQGAIIAALMYVAAGVLMGPVAAARGSFASLAAAAALGGGAAGLLGSWLAKLIGDRHAKRVEEHLNRGGLLLWVRTWNRDQEHRAVRILEHCSGEDVHIQSCHGGVCVPSRDPSDLNPISSTTC